MRKSITILKQTLQHNHSPYSHVASKQYATYKIHTPKPTTSSNEGLNNNPVMQLFRKKGTIVAQHSEIVMSTCEKTDCETVYCKEPCTQKTLTDESIAHATHANPTTRPDLELIILSTKKDLDGKVGSQAIVGYEKPHLTTGESVDKVKDALRTKNLNDILTEAYEKR